MCTGRIVIHRDLKPDNLVFSSDGVLKIIDFGLGKVIKRKYRVKSTLYQMTGGTGSLRYMAPEVANHREYNEKADVYSLCLILWEMLARTKPFNLLKRAVFYERVIDKAERPDLSILDCPESLTLLMQKAWHHDPHCRLAAREMLASLQAVAEEENQRYFLELEDELESSSASNRSYSHVAGHGPSHSGPARRKCATLDFSQTQDILVKEKDYVPKYRLSRAGLLQAGSSASTASFSTLCDSDMLNDENGTEKA